MEVYTYAHAPGKNTCMLRVFFGKEQSNNKNSKLRLQAEIIELSGACEASRVSHSYVQSIVLTFVDNYIVKLKQGLKANQFQLKDWLTCQCITARGRDCIAIF